MNRPEAYNIISAALERYRGLGFQALSEKVGIRASEDVLAPSGVRYTMDISVAWSDAQHRELIIRGRIDDQNSFRSSPLEEKICVSPVA